MKQSSLLEAFLDRPAPNFVLSSSFGNDSLAMLQWAVEAGLPQRHRCVTLYSDTGWAHRDWAARVEQYEAWARAQGFETARTSSVGMLALVERERGWPRHGMQFCTEHLKVLPAQAWMELVDPSARATVMIGKRRAESSKRADTPEYIASSAQSGGRRVWHPLYAHSHAERDALLQRAGVAVLPHRSDECFPCVNAGKEDIKRLTEDRIALIEGHEAKLGNTKKGSPRTMYRPERKRGATGIRAIVRWSHSKRGGFDMADFTGPSETETGCDGGWCAA
ncbi:phosphoadenosine phosphosulfate reductase family protein [Sphingomonas sp. AR_OL41]|uniref:phosphoadenosine phosphosulfate reductase domain-containing protein n=1 Tax=Sphingomonas sp. AR_OL41 TaxID=3042729 RepID=UPI00247FB0AD|nr:phosphoadenosine phosphosulfate reductase family protein [Sphingomonas sp. AR_OL41]MDH7973702.1 phosphoadenosine phosphosulfate reductase family protein [Sphingomonas sp. AR_OL41]